MAQHAAQLGANAVVGVRYDATEIMQGVTEVLCYGTAVVVKTGPVAAYSVNENRYLCIHGHFYQPPRENPWLEAIELQDSAAPYHDWNERITAECYAPNSAARILDAEGRIAKIVNNYSSISFNFGPTLLSWMKDKAPETYQAILDADRASAQRFSGHGSAIAQCYNHMIMPLANARDKLTQVIWGIEDFRFRFGRDPEGMWLPETAVDLETLDLMAQHGIQFTILAPSQAKSMDGIDVTGQRIDPARVYRQKLPSGRSINLFFYDGPVSQAVAFERLLNDGGRFARRLLDAFSDQREGPQLAHIATDGETYGHHHAFGDMALAYALDHIESSGLAKVTNYGEFLEKHPAEHDVEILENTAWSCVHGVGRWNANCGCNSGGHGEWNQEWRAPLREALDWLRDEIAPCYEKMAGRFFKDPWAARNNYIHVILDRSPESRERFAAANFRRKTVKGARSREHLEAARDAAPRHADVHQLRLVLRRADRHRNGAGDPIRRTRGATGRRAVRQSTSSGVSWKSWRSPRAIIPEHGDGAADLREVRQTRQRGSAQTGRALRHEFACLKATPTTRAFTPIRWTTKITA